MYLTCLCGVIWGEVIFGSLRVQSVLLLNVKLAFSARKTQWQHKGSPVFPKVERNTRFHFQSFILFSPNELPFLPHNLFNNNSFLLKICLPKWKVKMLVAQSCLTLCNPMDCSPPGSSFHGILQARILEWVAMSSSRGIFPTQGSSPGLLHCRQIPYCLSHQGSSNWGVTQFGVMIWMGILHLLL